MIFTITGPESCGKSTIFQALKDNFPGSSIPEYSREYLTQTQGKYTLLDIIEIAKKQIEHEHLAQIQSENILLDTDLITLKVWCEVVYGWCPEIISKGISEYRDRNYILLYPDIPWEPDPLRENPHNREFLFDIYEKEVMALGCPYRIIRREDKANQAMEYISSVLFAH